MIWLNKNTDKETLEIIKDAFGPKNISLVDTSFTSHSSLDTIECILIKLSRWN